MDAESRAAIETYAGITRRVIARNGFADFSPTVLYPRRKKILTLVGVPTDVDIESVSLEWAVRNSEEQEEFLLAFKLNESEFAVIRSTAAARDKEIFSAHD